MAGKKFVFTQQQIAALQDAGNSLSASLKRRAEALIRGFQGESTPSIARTLGTSERMVNEWAMAFHFAGIEGLREYNEKSAAQMHKGYTIGRLLDTLPLAKDYQERRRILVLVDLYMGASPRKIAEKFEISEAAVEAIRDSFNLMGSDFLPKKFTVKTQMKITAKSEPSVSKIFKEKHIANSDLADRMRVIELSQRGQAVNQIATMTGRTRNDVVSVIKAFNSNPFKFIGDKNVAKDERLSIPPSQKRTITVPEGITVKKIRDEMSNLPDGYRKNVLEAIANLVLYRNYTEALALSKVKEITLKRAFKAYSAGGLDAIPNDETSSDRLARQVRIYASKHTDADQAKRLELLARVYDGESVDGIAAIAGVSKITVMEWKRKYEARGIDAFPDKKAFHEVPEKPKRIIQTEEPSVSKQKESKTAASPERKPETSKLSAKQITVLQEMANDDVYPSRRLARMALECLRSGNVRAVAERHRADPKRLSAFIRAAETEVTRYQESRIFDFVSSVSVSDADVYNAIKANPDEELMEGLKSLYFLVRGMEISEIGKTLGLNYETVVSALHEICANWDNKIADMMPEARILKENRRSMAL